MASEAVIDIDELVAPISEDQPTGIDLRENSPPDSLYYKIKDARNTARAEERKGSFELEHWRTVLDIAPEILKTQTKDLEITSWYTEALIRIKGFAGLRDAFILLEQLIDKYWDNIYPVPDEDGIETRVAPLSGLNGQGAEGVLIAPIRRVVITEGDEPGPFGLWQYQQALDVQKITDENERKKKIETVGFGLEDIQKAVASSSQTFFVNQRDDITICIEKYREISRKLDELCGPQDAPSSSNIITALQQSLGAIKHLGQNKLPANEVEVSGENSTEEGDTSMTAEQQQGQQAASGPIRNREHAFEQLQVISEYFLKTEPHSPISYTLEKTVRWGNMSLTELINELIPDGNSRQLYSSLTGVKSDN
ncbi:type VI secretion system protein TssA [Aliikangiella sp. IMCC44359]|uniref:type VI secretion system protein TssA n=1 Tax=Aliikangiella sp. IMCC44359 TaxID=3459125 RepID=UPI00403B24E5